jgi:hypothetical protein
VYEGRDLAASECRGDSLATQSGFSELAASGGRLVRAFVRAQANRRGCSAIHGGARERLLLYGRAVDVL